MRTGLAFFCALLALAVLSCAQASSLSSVAPMINFMGRVDLSNASEAVFDWGVAFSFAFWNGSYFSVHLDEVSKEGHRYWVFIDGVAQSLSTKPKQAAWYSFNVVGNHEHYITIQRKTEAIYGRTTLRDITLSDGAQFIAPKPAPNTITPIFKPSSSPIKRMEFYGDSLTCGYGALGTAPCAYTIETEDMTQAYARLTAGLLGVEDYHIQCWSGKGAVRNYGAKNTTSPDPFPVYIPRTLGNVASSNYDFSYDPDIVVITLGGNDFSTQPHPTFEQFHQAYHHMLTLMYDKYPNVKYVFLGCGPLGHNPNDYLQQIVKLEQPLFPRTCFVTAHGIFDDPADMGCANHPSVQGHHKFARAFAKTIKAVWDESN